MSLNPIRLLPAAAILLLAVALSGCGGGGGGGGNDSGAAAPPAPASPPQVTVSVAATDPKGAPLSYQWQATDGSIVDVNSAATTWTLPAGPGLHFAYVMISNGRGGYLERRVAVSTDSIGVAALVPAPQAFDAPPSAAATGVPFRSVQRGSSYYNSDDGIYLPDLAVFLQRTAPNGSVTTAQVTTDLRGVFTVQDVPPGTYDVECRYEPTAAFQPCYTDIEFLTTALHDPYAGPGFERGDLVGRAVMSDGKACGTLNEYFGKATTGSVSITNAGGTVLAGPYRLNAWGHFGLNTRAGATSLRLQCEGAQPVTVAAPAVNVTPRVVFADAATPVVSSMSARLGSQEVGTYLPPPTGRSADAIADSEFFLGYKGVDSRTSACKYYLATGAVKGCDSAGTPQGAITFDDWRRKMKMEPFADAGVADIVATYINRIDLNLTRRHHSLSTGANQLAAYVCNHKGPADESQAAADTAIDDAVAGRNLIACVAMDHGVTAGVNGNAPFTRFMAFGPAGNLLTSVNLDGRGEKFVPGTCVACHGGDKYAGRFNERAGASPDIGAHFLPYDLANFRFSSRVGLRAADQQAAIKALNLNVLKTNPTTAITELVNGWYAGGATTQNVNYLPASWSGRTAAALAFYRDVYASSCRTCHVAYKEALNFDHYANLTTNAADPPYQSGITRSAIAVCQGSASHARNFSMPNSLRTHSLFWDSQGTAVDQPAITAAFFTQLQGATVNCALTTTPAP